MTKHGAFLVLLSYDFYDIAPVAPSMHDPQSSTHS